MDGIPKLFGPDTEEPKPRPKPKPFPFRLKKARERDLAVCAASRCSEPSVIIEGSRKRDKGDVPLCERHWSTFCKADDS